MKRLNKKNINSETYWDSHIAEPKFGLRQKKYLSLAGKGNKIIELGCGLSHFLDRARNHFKECVGIDFSVKTIIEARDKYPKVEYLYGDATKTNLGDKEFDVSVAGEVIEHLENPQKLIDEMKRITKRRIIISTARMEYNDPEHLWEFTKKDLKKWGKVEEIRSSWFPGRSYLFLTIDL
jgi:ubiquinone/menaquinone biosynthesis C-methylase UbiE